MSCRVMKWCDCDIENLSKGIVSKACRRVEPLERADAALLPHPWALVLVVTAADMVKTAR